MKTKETTIRMAHGIVQIPAGLPVKPAPAFQLLRSEGFFVLDNPPEAMFPKDCIVSQEIKQHWFTLREAEA